jgi:mono/diheme cytochrome c family protein
MTSPTAHPAPTRSRRLPLLLILGGVLFLVALVVFAAVFSRDRTPAANDALVRGQQVYEGTCSGCHGRDGQGLEVPNAPPLNGSGDVWTMPPELLRMVVQSGTHEGMPAFGQRLSEAEVDAVLAYIQSWWSPEQRARYLVGGQTGAQP